MTALSAGSAAAARARTRPVYTIGSSRSRYPTRAVDTYGWRTAWPTGQWCSASCAAASALTCRAELQAWHDAIPRLEAVGGHFIAVSAEVGGRAEETRCGLAPNAEMLCDVDHGLALSLGLAHPMGPELHAGYRSHGLDLAEIYGDSGMLLPIPATFVIDSGGIVRYAFVEPDFRIRPDPAVVIAVVEACGPKSASL
jgi:peroxiredoxin